MTKCRSSKGSEVGVLCLCIMSMFCSCASTIKLCACCIKSFEDGKPGSNLRASSGVGPTIFSGVFSLGSSCFGSMVSSGVVLAME
jgi:hypothetical protein